LIEELNKAKAPQPLKRGAFALEGQLLSDLRRNDIFARIYTLFYITLTIHAE